MQPQRIFVRAPNWVGDLVMATAAFVRLRAGYPGAQITCGLRPYLRSLLDGAGYFDRYLETPPARRIGDLLRQVGEVRRHRFDLAVVFPNSLETALVPFLARVPRRVGYRQGRPLLLNAGLTAAGARPPWRLHGPRRTPKPMPIYYDELLDVLALPPGPLHPVLHVTPSEQAAADAWLRARGIGPETRVVTLNAGASYGASKLWEPDRFAAVARHFRERLGMAAVFLSGPSEAEMVRAIAARAGAHAAVDPVLPVGMLKPLIARSALLITTDSGPRHVAVALDVPVVCLIGPNDRRYTDYCLERTRVIQKDLPCVPCQQKVCPLGHRHCMTTIEIDEVIRAGEELL